ncbi:MAG: hypothetical protein FJY10_12060, partial [Bacteroidetes bacterium]|nr:hypothetical protein [Bacteroidota bacterium]
MMIPVNSLRHITCVALLAGLLLSVQAFAQIPQKHVPQVTPKGKGKVDLRIDAINYWKKMQRLGYVTPNPVVKVPKAEVTPPAKTNGSARFLDSPDVPVSLLSNTTQSENSIFINPTDVDNALNSNNSTDWVSGYVGTLYGANDFYTFDQGLTWQGEVEGAGGDNSGDPATAIGLNGYYYINFINPAYGQSFAFSTDQGQNWQQVLIANAGSGGFSVLDKNHMWIDNRPTSPYVGNLYVAWTNFTGGPNDSEIELCRSTNNGINWSSPIAVSEAVNAGSHNQGVNLQTGPNGEVYAVWAIYDGFPEDETALGFAKSTNGGVSFQPATRIISNIRGIRMTETSKDMRVNSFPVMAVDISGGAYNGNIYIVWCNIGVPGINTGNDKDVYIIKSADGGTTWSAPIRVNQDPAGLGKEHYFPWITCDPVTGSLSVVYYDDRNVTSDKCQAYVSVSTNAGETWEDFKVSDVSFTPTPIGGLAGGYFGDYLGITARNRVVYPCWTDNRDGRAMTYVS